MRSIRQFSVCIAKSAPMGDHVWPWLVSFQGHCSACPGHSTAQSVCALGSGAQQAMLQASLFSLWKRSAAERCCMHLGTHSARSVNSLSGHF